MLPATELRIARALAKTYTPVHEIARAWNVSTKVVERIGKKHQVKRIRFESEKYRNRPGKR